MINSAQRELPEYIEGYGKVTPFKGIVNHIAVINRIGAKIKPVSSGESKLLNSIEEALDKMGIQDGMTISFHHHLRNGDYVLNLVMKAIAARGIKDITLAASSIFPSNEPLVEYIKKGIVTCVHTAYMSGPVADAISEGFLKKPAVMHTHGGRARAIESGELHIDIAFIAAPTSDDYGNINGVFGKAACGALGYAVADAKYADMVVVITDNIVDYPACPIEISQEYIDYVVKVEAIGDSKGIVSGTTKITKDPVGLKIAKMATEVMVASGLVKNGLSFQTGAGGISLAVAEELKHIMRKQGIKGSFAAGGITGYIVEMMEEGLFEKLFDVQCFDLRAVESYRDNYNHQGMSASLYGNPHNKGSVVNKLDVMILGATEIDVNFNVNVTTASDGRIMGGSGGHSDTAAGAKLALVVTSLTKARLPIIKERVVTVTTPGETVDVIVTEWGIAVNPLRQDLIEKIRKTRLPLFTVEELKDKAEKITGKPALVEREEKIVAVVEYRDGTVIDVIRKIK